MQPTHRVEPPPLDLRQNLRRHLPPQGHRVKGLGRQVQILDAQHLLAELLDAPVADHLLRDSNLSQGGCGNPVLLVRR